MNPLPPNPPTPRRELQLQGPRPTPLKLNKESVKIKKPPPHPLPSSYASHQQQQQQQQQQLQQQQQQYEPVVIYAVSPKVIHASVNDFMSIVQRLTGPSSSPPSGDLSPAARLASIHKASSPKFSTSDHSNHNSSVNRNYDTITTAHDDLMATILNNLEGGAEIGQFPGILSPGAAALPPIPSGFFSPAFNWQGGGIGFNFTAASPSPSSAAASALFSAPLVSPSPSSWDLFNNFLNRA